MDLIQNSGLDSVPHGLLVELEAFRDLGHRQELIWHVLNPTDSNGWLPLFGAIPNLGL